MLGFNLGFIGAGQMARAIGISLVQKGLLSPNQITVSSPEASHLDIWKGHGCNTTSENGEVLVSSQAVMWAVKPQYFEAALKDVGSEAKGMDNFHVSVMAGVPLSKFSNLIKSQIGNSKGELRAARVMPNIAMQVGSGVSVFTMGDHCTNKDCDNLTKILSTLGLTYQVPEQQINAYCGLFASGIGFMFPILEGMADGGVKMGIPRDLSVQIAAQTMKGAAELILNSSKLQHPGQLKDSVCSPGGTTIEGVATLEKCGVRSALMQAIEASTKRGEDLDKSLKK